MQTRSKPILQKVSFLEVVMKKYLWLICIFFISPLCSRGDANMVKMLNKINQSVVNIETTIIHSAGKTLGITYGTGFLINKEKGIFLTNSHIASPGSVCRYTLQFANGKEAPAKLVYYDPWQDFAFLKVSPTDIPEEAEALLLKPKGVVQNEEVFIVGNNGGRDYSFLSGRIASVFESMGIFPNQSFRITLNNSPGSSGSPVLNMEGSVIGIIHSGNDAASAFALPMDYVVDSLRQLLEGRAPSRKHTGALVEYISLDKVEKFLKFPLTASVSYVKKYPEARRKILRVSTVLKGSPAEGVLMPGDILLSINGRPIGPNLYEMDKLIDGSRESLSIEVYRYGEKKLLTVNTYDLQAHKINQLIIAGGATFYEVDDVLRLQTGVVPHSIFVTNIQRGGNFYYAPIPFIPDTDKLLIQIIAINNTPIKNLEGLKAFFAALNQETHLHVRYSNFGYYYAYSRTFMFNQAPQAAEVTYNPIDMPLMVFEFDEKEMDWVKR